MTQRLNRQVWLWGLMGLALVAISAFLISPVFSADSPAPIESEITESLQPVAIPAASAAELTEPIVSSSSDTVEDTGVVAVAAAPASDNCIACHTDKELLQQLAEEPEEVASELSAGEG